VGRNFIRQDTQARQSDLYDDTLAAGSTLESAPINLEDDLNAIRSQAKRFIWADSAGNWYDDVPTVNGKKRAILGLNTGLDALEEKMTPCPTQVLTDIAIGAGVNFKILVVASSQAPSVVGSSNATTEGAIVALSAFSDDPDFGQHELVEVPGPNAILPQNLVTVRDATTGQILQSAGRDIYALLQAESTFTDGNAFNDVATEDRVKLSFVRLNAGLDDLEACPVADIENKTINYQYVRRVKFSNADLNCMLGRGIFLDQAGLVDVTLDRAIDNQSGPATQAQNIEVRISDGFDWAFQDPSGAADILRIAAAGGGDSVAMNVTDLDVNNTNTADFSNGAAFDTSGTAINVGATAGQIDSAGALSILTAAGGILRLDAAGELRFDDGYRASSTWVQDHIPLADTAAEWTAFKASFGEVSLMNAITQAYSSSVFQIGNARVTTNVNADVNVTGAGGTPNIDVQLPDYSGASSFVNQVRVYVNGIRNRPGADASANHDVYPGTTPANGDLKFEYKLKTGDEIILEYYP
jgi:hypothetical protein